MAKELTKSNNHVNQQRQKSIDENFMQVFLVFFLVLRHKQLPPSLTFHIAAME